MKAAVFKGMHEVSVEKVPEPQIQQPTDVVIRVTVSAVCGSDLHLYHNKIPGLLPGAVLGHEYVGVVEEVGSQVRMFAKGDRVIGAFNPACGICEFCRRGAYNLCKNGGILGYGMAFGNLAGTQAEYARIPFADTTLRKVPKTVSDEQAIFCGDILTTAYGAVKNAALVPGETVAVIGAGPVGLLAVQSAFAQGAAKVLSLDLVDERLQMAEEFGAIPINSSKNATGQVMEQTDGIGADVVIEAVGGTPTILMAFDLVRPGGRVSTVGITAEPQMTYPLMSSLVRDLTFRIGVANILRDIDTTLRLVESGRLQPERIISDRFSLDDVPQAYQKFANRQILKAIVSIN
ncbi:MAG: alcohol dehydrogenase catalytic domain-containing protein [Firmicutes bacterium]|nr:alcohol dehydrogenase catalytic domain-containing protein [Bacillota bacterium]